MTSVTTLMLSMLVVLAGQDSRTRQALETLDAVETVRSADLEPALADLRAGLSVNDRPAWERALALVQKSDCPLPIRSGVLSCLFDRADTRGHLEVIAVADLCARRSQGQSTLQDDGVLLARVVTHLHKPGVWASVRAEPAVAVFLGHMMDWRLKTDPGARTTAGRLLSNCSVPPDLVRSIVLDLIRQGSDHDLWPIPPALLRADMIPDLRRMVRERVDSVHLSAAGALAHLGDGEIRSDLVARQKGDGNWVVAQMIWQIDAQRSTAALLRAVGNTRGPTGSVGQRWALARAVELDADKARLREVVLQFAAGAEPFVFEGKKLPSADVVDLKALALQLGVLQPDDLPDVPGPIKVTP